MALFYDMAELKQTAQAKMFMSQILLISNHQQLWLGAEYPSINVLYPVTLAPSLSFCG